MAYLQQNAIDKPAKCRHNGSNRFSNTLERWFVEYRNGGKAKQIKLERV
jgi:hypothetical protein